MNISQPTTPPAITINDAPAQEMTKLSSKYYKYEGDGLVKILEDGSDLGDLLRIYRIDDGIDGWYWTEKLLRHILTRKRIKAELERPEYRFSDQQVADYIDKIHPQSDASPPQVYLKIFALLLLVDHPGDIGKFIDERFCDQSLPIVIKHRQVCLIEDTTETPINCFGTWKSKDKDSFQGYQYQLDTPYFGTTQDQSLIEFQLWPKTCKPWRTTPNNGDNTNDDTTENEGAYGVVVRSDIHPTAHSYGELLTGINLDSTTFAIKTMLRMDAKTEKTFKTEWDMLKRFSGLAHPHLVTALSAFTQAGKWSFIFPNASCDLEQYMEASRPPNKETGARWISKQMLGLIGALHTIHNPKHLHLEVEKKRYGRHGDIKSDNILCFKRSGNTTEKVLVISDFGLSAFNTDKSRSNIPNQKVPPVPGYRPPECDIEGGTVSRAFDVWTMGCLFLELITWFLGGPKYLKEFNDKRTTPFINSAKNNIFFTFKYDKTKRTYVVLVKPEVTEWILSLHQHSECSQFLHDVLDIIQQKMLVVLSKDRQRSSSETLLRSFEQVRKNFKDQDSYGRANPWKDDELEGARARMSENTTAVEVVPSKTALSLMQDLKVELPVHRGETKKSLQAAEYKDLAGESITTR